MARTKFDPVDRNVRSSKKKRCSGVGGAAAADAGDDGSSFAAARNSAALSMTAKERDHPSTDRRDRQSRGEEGNADNKGSPPKQGHKPQEEHTEQRVVEAALGVYEVLQECCPDSSSPASLASEKLDHPLDDHRTQRLTLVGEKLREAWEESKNSSREQQQQQAWLKKTKSDPQEEQQMLSIMTEAFASELDTLRSTGGKQLVKGKSKTTTKRQRQKKGEEDDDTASAFMVGVVRGTGQDDDNDDDDNYKTWNLNLLVDLLQSGVTATPLDPVERQLLGDAMEIE